MANTKNCKSGSVQNADTVVCDILKKIKNEKLAAESLFNSEETKQKSKTAAKKYKLCCLQKAEESHHLYQNILTCVIMENSKRVELLQTNIGEYISIDGQIASLIQESSKLLKEFKTATEATNNAACALANCVKNKAPQLFPKNGKGKGKRDETNSGQELDVILEIAKQLDKKAQNAFESMVTLAGIQIFGKTKNLTQFITEVSECMNSFKTMIESNVLTTFNEVVDIRTSLNDIMQELAVVTTTKYSHATTFTGLESVRKFVCGDCEDGFIDICADCDPCDDHHEEDRSPKQRSSELQSADQD